MWMEQRQNDEANISTLSEIRKKAKKFSQLFEDGDQKNQLQIYSNNSSSDDELISQSLENMLNITTQKNKEDDSRIKKIAKYRNFYTESSMKKSKGHNEAKLQGSHSPSDNNNQRSSKKQLMDQIRVYDTDNKNLQQLLTHLKRKNRYLRTQINTESEENFYLRARSSKGAKALSKRKQQKIKNNYFMKHTSFQCGSPHNSLKNPCGKLPKKKATDYLLAAIRKQTNNNKNSIKKKGRKHQN